MPTDWKTFWYGMGCWGDPNVRWDQSGHGLKTSTIYPVKNGVDGRFRDSAARQFHHQVDQVVADFVLGMVAAI
jgi:hypothetical protein